MARPSKQGLEYFPLDVNMDDKVKIIEAQHGIIGFGLIIKLYQKIYSEGYYYPWTEKEQLLFSNAISLKIDIVNEIVRDCIKWGIFNDAVFNKHNILTSKGIQERYIAVTYKRTNIKLDKRYLLIEVNDKKNIDITGVSDIRKPPITIINDIKSTQSKVKESKVNKNDKDICVTQAEKLVDKSSGAHSNVKDGKGNYTDDFIRFWDVYPRDRNRAKAYKVWKTRLRENHSAEDMIKAAKNYADECKLKGTEETYIKHAATFIGPDKPFTEYINFRPQHTEQNHKKSYGVKPLDCKSHYDYDAIEKRLEEKMWEDE